MASVGNGKLAVEQLDKTDVDAIILDIEMPVMDGITALPLLLEKKPDLVVLVASTLSQKNADISLKCLDLGAKDYIPKPTTQSFALDENSFRRELIQKVKSITQTVRDQKGKSAPKLPSHQPAPSRPVPTPGNRVYTPSRPAEGAIKRPADTRGVQASAPQQLSQAAGRTGAQTGSQKTIKVFDGMQTIEIALRPLSEVRPKAVVIGCSTGGPQALAEVFKVIRGDLAFPIFVAQHMPPIFTKSLAANIQRVSGLTAKEGEEGEVVKNGCVYVAPGGYHMEVKVKGDQKLIHLNQSPPENFCRPSVNPILRTVARAYKGECLLAMLTGLGADGLQGAEELVNAGGSVVSQDKETSVVWGMPAAVAKAGFSSAVVPISHMGRLIMNIVNALNPRSGVVIQ